MPFNWLSRIKTSIQSEESAPATLDTARLYATLMLEIAQADQVESDAEQRVIEESLKRVFALNDDDCRLIARDARNELAKAPGLYQFTREVNETMTLTERKTLIRSLWLVALADNHIDKYEEAAIRKIADLLYVSHGDFMQAKHSAQQTASER